MCLSAENFPAGSKHDNGKEEEQTKNSRKNWGGKKEQQEGGGGGIALGNRGDEKCIYPPPLTPFLHHLKKRWREKTLYKQLAT